MYLPMRKALRELLDQGRLEQIADMALRKKRVLGSLIAATFDADAQTGWRAVEAMGLATSRIAQSDPQYVRSHLERLYWLLNEESGGICWHAPQAMAEIVRPNPKLFADYIPIIVFLLLNMAEEDLGHFRAAILWAIGRLGTVAGDQIQEVLPAITTALDNADPQVRGMAVWCLVQTGQSKCLAGRPDLLADTGPVDLYEDAHLCRTNVRDLVQQAVTT